MNGNKVAVFLMAGALVLGCEQADPTDPDVGTEERTLSDCVTDGEALTEVWSVGNGHGAVGAMALSGDTVALASADGSIKTWNLISQGKEELVPGGAAGGGLYGGEFGAETGTFSALGFSSDGSRILAGDSDGNVGLFEMNGAYVSGTSTGQAMVRAVASRPDGARVAMVNANFAGDIGVWDPSSQELVSPLTTILWGAQDVAYSADGKRLVVVGNWYGLAAIEIWGAGSLETSLGSWVAPNEWLSASSDISAFAIDDTGSRAVVAGFDPLEPEGSGFVAVLDVEAILSYEGEGWSKDPAVASGLLNLEGHAVRDLAMQPGGGVVASAGADGTVRLYDESVSEKVVLDAPGTRAVAFTDDGERLITTGDDGSLRLWGCPQPQP